MREIFERKSVRSFLPDEVPRQHIERLINAAMQAPSAGNQQPWDFFVLTDKKKMIKVMDFHQYATPLKEAPCAIVICVNPEYQKFPQEYWIQDCAAATQNLLLEAVHLDLGAVWLGIYPQEERVEGMRKLFDIPEDIIPFSIVALGYPSDSAKEKSPRDNFKADRIHYETW